MTHPGSFSATSESLTALGCFPLRMTADPKNVVERYVLSIRPRYDAFIDAGEGHALYWTSLTQVNRFRRERDIYSPVKNLSFLKMTPCLNAGEQHEQISVKLLNYSMY